MTLKVKKLRDDAKVPQTAYAGDAGIDLCAAEDVELAPGARAVIPTGIAIELPPGTVGLIWDKSGVARKQGIKTMGGVIDEGYRGEVGILVANLSNEPQTITKGQKAAQLLVQKVEHVEIEEAAELADSERGAQGWGSSGTH